MKVINKNFLVKMCWIFKQPIYICIVLKLFNVPHMDDKNLELIIRAETLFDAMSTQCYLDQVRIIGMLSAMCAIDFGVNKATSNLIADEVELFLQNNINIHSEGVKHNMFHPPFDN